MKLLRERCDMRQVDKDELRKIEGGARFRIVTIRPILRPVFADFEVIRPVINYCPNPDGTMMDPGNCSNGLTGG